MKNWLNKNEGTVSKIGAVSLIIGLIFLAYDLPWVTWSIILINVMLMALVLKYRK